MPGLASAAAGLTRIQLARGDVGRACDHAQAALEAVRAKGVWVWAGEIAPAVTEAWLAAGRAADAERLLAELGDGLRDRDAPAVHAARAFTEAMLVRARGNPEAAAGRFDTAAQAWRALPRPHEAALAEEHRASSLLEAGSDGVAPLQAALRTFRELGASWDAARVRRTARAHGIRVPKWRVGRPSYGGALSPREQDVARLASTGMTNRQIAEALFISPRTVEDHLSAARRKLGVTGRQDLWPAADERSS